MEKITCFDVEYANSKNKAICQLGIVCENYNDHEPYYPELDIYVNLLGKQVTVYDKQILLNPDSSLCSHKQNYDLSNCNRV